MLTVITPFFHSRNLCCGIIASRVRLARASVHDYTRCNNSQGNDAQDNDIQHTVLNCNTTNDVKLSTTFL